MILESGPAKTDRTYWLVVGLIFIAYAGWCVYDGAVRYPDQNCEEAVNALQQWTIHPARPTLRFTEDDFKRVRDSNPTRADLRKAFGPPVSDRSDADRFASIFGLVTAPLNSSGRLLVDKMSWQRWSRRPDDIRLQYGLAILVAVIAVFLLRRAYKAWTLRATLDDEGMTYGGRRIAYADMVSLRDYNPKGWVDLYYRTGAGEKKLRIDNQKIAKFDEIAQLICEKRDFQNPITADTEAEEPEDSEPAPPSS